MPSPIPAIALMSAWLVGTWVAVLPLATGREIATSVTILSLLFWFHTWRRIYLFPIFLLICCQFGILYTVSWRQRHYYPVINDTFSGHVLTLEGSIQREEITTTLVLTEASNVRLILREKGTHTHQPGRRLFVSGATRPPPFQVASYARHLEQRRIQGFVIAKTVRATPSEPGHTKTGLLFSLLGARLEGLIMRQIPGEPGQLLAGLILGAQQSLSSELTAALRVTGTSHLVAISGANVAVILGMILKVLPIYRLKPRFFATCLLSACICLLTGSSASVVRGALTVSISSLLQTTGHVSHRGSLFILPAFIMSLGNPMLISSNVGFQLSFAAMAGILFLQPKLQILWNTLPPLRKFPSIVSTPTIETAAATLATAPVGYLVFGTTSWLGLIVNPLLLWMIPVITLLGLLLVIFSWLAPAQAILILFIAPFLRLFLGCIRWFANLTL